MAKQCHIITYHFVREPEKTPYPRIKALHTLEFIGQIEYLQRHFTFVTMEECVQAVHGGRELPANAVLLTFDDGYSDHYRTVLPILLKYGIQGAFFPSAKAVSEFEVLAVNKIHFVLACVDSVEDLLQDLYLNLDTYRETYSLESNEYYFEKYAKPWRYDPIEVVFVKRLLQKGLPRPARDRILDHLFAKYVTADEASFAADLYMSREELESMIANGMYVGNHGYDHAWLSQFSPAEQGREIDLSLAFLNEIGAPKVGWVMCYPYGDYNESLLQVVEERHCSVGLTTKPGISRLERSNALTLERLNTNDFPKRAEGP